MHDFDDHEFFDYEEDGYEYDEDYFEDEWDDHGDDEAYDHFDDMFLENVNPPPEEWRSVRLGATTIEVSTDGRVKASRSWFEPATEGWPCTGTPYRTYPIVEHDGTRKHVMMHQLIWHTFHGAVPNGWEVRHQTKPCASGYYNNALANLTILPKLVPKEI